MPAHDFLEGLESDGRGRSRAPESAERSTSAESHALRPTPAMSAATVLRLQRSVGNAGTAALLQRDEDETLQREGMAGPASPVHGTISGPGSPLDSATRSTMEESLGADFASVRLHVDAKSAESVQAAAYTVGEDIVVHPDHFSSGTPQAQRTLAHELTHVKQQRSGPVDGTPRSGGIQVSDPSDRFEQEAVRTSDAVMSGNEPGHAGHRADEEYS